MDKPSCRGAASPCQQVGDEELVVVEGQGGQLGAGRWSREDHPTTVAQQVGPLDPADLLASRVRPEQELV